MGYGTVSAGDGWWQTVGQALCRIGDSLPHEMGQTGLEQAAWGKEGEPRRQLDRARIKGRWAAREGGSKWVGQGKENGKKKKRNEMGWLELWAQEGFGKLK
jgi:hypothetical protein